MLLKGQKVHDTLINHSVRKIVVFFLAVEEGGGGGCVGSELFS